MIKRYGGKKFDTSYLAQHEDNVGHYLKRSAREKLVQNFIMKWGSKDLGERLDRRRNLTQKDKDYIGIVIGCFIQNCPYDTGNGILRGINYTTKGKRIVFQIGGWFAPYIVHLAEPHYRWPTRVAGWTTKAQGEAIAYLNKFNPNLDLVETDLGYGYQEFELIDMSKIYDYS